jgi:hypothetical protein
MNVEDALAGTSTVTTRLHSLRGRVPYAAKLRLFDAVAAEVGDSRIGLALGRTAVVDPVLAPLRAAVRALGSPAAALRYVSRISTRVDSAGVFRCRVHGYFLGGPTDAAELRQALLTGCDPAGVAA